MSGTIMIEGGAGVISSLISHPLVHHMRVFRAPILIGSNGVELYPKNEICHLTLQSSRRLGEGQEEMYLIE